tara:strand:- start:847 stop:1566 length:720 start_codon:yes stop_codon:yes gene_type:complete
MDYECTLIVSDIGYSSLTKKDQKDFEIVGHYNQKYIQSVLEDNKLATPYEKRKDWTDNPKETFDFIFNKSTNGFADLLKISGVEKLEDVDTDIHIKTLPKYSGSYKEGDLSQKEFLIEEKKGKKEGVLFIPKVFIKEVHLIGGEGWWEDTIDREQDRAEFIYMGGIDYKEICKEVDDVNLWVHEEIKNLNYAQLEKIHGRWRGESTFVDCYSPLYEGDPWVNFWSEIYEYQLDEKLIVC